MNEKLITLFLAILVLAFGSQKPIKTDLISK